MSKIKAAYLFAGATAGAALLAFAAGGPRAGTAAIVLGGIVALVRAVWPTLR